MGISNQKRSAGLKAQAFGSLFEGIFETMAKNNGVGITRIPDSCKQVSALRLIRVKSPFDWVLTFENRTAVIDTKTSHQKKFPASQISEHQLKELLIHENKGAIAGYVIWLRKPHQVFFIPAKILRFYFENGGSFDHTHPEAIILGQESFDVRHLFWVHSNQTLKKMM